ncbi:MAG: hypothetical protein ACREO8_09305 [Luteimonas sp.]
MNCLVKTVAVQALQHYALNPLSVTFSPLPASEVCRRDVGRVAEMDVNT